MRSLEWYFDGLPAGRPGYGPSQVLTTAEDCGRHWGRMKFGSTSPTWHATAWQGIHHRWDVPRHDVESGPYSDPAVSALVFVSLVGLEAV